jgi:hypothetical protein
VGVVSLTAPPPGILERVPDEIRRQFPDEVVDQLLAGARSEEEIVGPGGLLAQLTQRLVERAFKTRKTLSTEHGPVEIRTPRDRG